MRAFSIFCLRDFRDNFHVSIRFYICFYFPYSMGGAVAVHVAKANLLPSLVGLVVIDVVEGIITICYFD